MRVGGHSLLIGQEGRGNEGKRKPTEHQEVDRSYASAKVSQIDTSLLSPERDRTFLVPHYSRRRDGLLPHSGIGRRTPVTAASARSPFHHPPGRLPATGSERRVDNMAGSPRAPWRPPVWLRSACCLLCLSLLAVGCGDATAVELSENSREVAYPAGPGQLELSAAVPPKPCRAGATAVGSSRVAIAAFVTKQAVIRKAPDALSRS